MIDYEFKSDPGTVTIERGGRVLWSEQIRGGEAEMCLLCATSSINISNSRPIDDREICTFIVPNAIVETMHFSARLSVAAHSAEI